MAGFKWQTPPDKVWPAGAEAYVRAVKRGIHGVMQRWAPEIENYMKSNASWQDQTANARQTLHSAVEPPTAAEVVSMIELIMAHGVIYGAYLEGYDPRYNFAPTRQGSRYAIIEPTLDYFAPRVWADVVRLFS